MKKLFLLFTAILITALMCATFVSAGDYIIWDFTDADTVARWVPSSTTNVKVTEKGAVFSGSGNNMNLTYTPATDEVIELSDYPILAIGYCDGTCAGPLQFYHWTEGCEGNPRVETTISAGVDGVLKFNPADTTQNTHSDWEGVVTKLRLDPCRAEAKRSHTIRFVALFETATDYMLFIKNGFTSVEPAYGEPMVIYNPGENNACFGTLGNDIEINYEDNYAIIEALSSNVFVTQNVYFDADEYPWVKVRLKNPGNVSEFELYCASDDTNGSVTASSRVKYPISAGDTEFKEYIFNVRDVNMTTTGATTSVWGQNISKVRFDFMNGNVSNGTTMYVDYIAFFASEEEAANYTPTADTEIEEALINSGCENPTWIFNSREDVAKLTASQMDLTLECGVMHVTPTGTDPIVSFSLSAEEQFSTNEFPYFAYRHNTTSTVSTVGIFFTTTNLTSLTDASYSPFTVNKTGVWQNAIVDLSDVATYPKANWTGDCTLFRIDPINGFDLDASIYIDRMGFFRTKTDAYNFLSQGVTDLDYTQSAIFTDNMQKAYIPENTLYSGFERSEFMMASPVASGEGESPVVVHTDAEGNRDIISRSYSTSGGYTAYIAEKPGTYTLEYNDKEFTDVTSHWAKDDIGFVTAREIFGGTSETEFSPDMPMTNAMFITVLGRTEEIDTTTYTGNGGFSDVNPDSYYAPYVVWALEEGFIQSSELFKPEYPITRGEAAEILYAYVNKNAEVLTCYDDSVEFTDVDAEDFDAIDLIQRTAILKGINDEEFDPDGMLTRGECAVILKNTVQTCLGLNDATTEYDADYFTRDRIRIGAWGVVSQLGTVENMTKLRDLGVDLLVSGSAMSSSTTKNLVFNYADKYGIEVQATEFPTTKSTYQNEYDLKAHTAYYAHHPSFTGHYFTDEPGSDDFPWLGELAKYYTDSLPGKRPFVNLLPMYANAAQLKFGAGAAAIEYYDPDPELYRKHCQMWFENFDVDYICTDIYPLNGYANNKSTWYTYKDYCESINQIATVARENDAEFWCCIQTWGWTNGKRNPSEMEYRWQCYTMLSYGCTGILLWSVTTSSRDFPSIFNIYTDEVTQPLYDDCKTVMWEMRNLSDTFVQYKNLGAFTHNYSTDVPYLRMTGEYTDFTILSDVQCDNPLLFGCFEKKEGTGYAFTVVNMVELNSDTESEVKFKLSQNSTVTLYRKNVFTQLTPDSSGYYTINLECGEGVFVTIA